MREKERPKDNENERDSKCTVEEIRASLQRLAKVSCMNDTCGYQQKRLLRLQAVNEEITERRANLIDKQKKQAVPSGVNC